jgi:hypothetical protein
MRIAHHHLIAAFSLVLTAAVTLGASSRNVVAENATPPDENVKQIALTEAQVENFIAAQKDINAIVAAAPQGDQPDPKIMEQLEAVSKKFQFANYAELEAVDENIGLIMSGIDPDTKKYVGPDAVIKKEITTIDSEKLPADDKKEQVEELQSELNSPADQIQFPGNIDLVVKNFDRLNAALAPAQ